MTYNKRYLFSRAQIIFISAVAGMLPASLMLTKNSETANGNSRGGTFKMLGYLFLAATYFLGQYLERHIVIESLSYFEKDIAYEITSLITAQIILIIPFIGVVSLLGREAFKKTKLSVRRSWFHILPYFLIGLAISAAMSMFGSFFFTLFLVYLLPNLYLHSKIDRLFISQRKRNWFAFFFILLVGLFPLSGRLIPFHQDVLTRVLALTGYYYAPILMYVFFLYLLTDIMLLINRKTYIVPSKIVLSRKFNLIVFFSVVLISLVIVGKGVYNYNNTMISRYKIEVPKRSGQLNELKIVMAADLHISEITNKFFVRQFVEKVNELEPDIVLLSGDIIDSNHSNTRIRFVEEQLSTLKSKYGVFAAEGNHELYRQRYRFDFFENSNILLLRDSVINIDNAFQVVGRKDRHDRRRLSIEKLLTRASDSLPVILLDHQPYNLEKAYNYPIDIQLSGHTHYGQLFPINLIIENMYELAWGNKKMEDTHYFVTCGAQGWGPQVKTASRSEIMEINVRFVD